MRGEHISLRDNVEKKSYAGSKQEGKVTDRVLDGNTEIPITQRLVR